FDKGSRWDVADGPKASQITIYAGDKKFRLSSLENGFDGLRQMLAETDVLKNAGITDDGDATQNAQKNLNIKVNYALIGFMVLMGLGIMISGLYNYLHPGHWFAGRQMKMVAGNASAQPEVYGGSKQHFIVLKLQQYPHIRFYISGSGYYATARTA